MRLSTYCILIFVTTFLVYFSSFWNQFVWDDEQFIYKNAFVQLFDVAKIFTTSTTAGSGIQSNYYRPLTTLSFAIDHSLWGLREFPFHSTNTFFHAATAVLIFLLLHTLRFSKKASLSIALIFALHPIQTEAVTYINSRGDSLYSFFTISTLLLTISIYKKIIPKIGIYNLTLSFGAWQQVVLTAFTYLAAILSKEIGIVALGLQGICIAYLFLTNTTPINKKFMRTHITLGVSVCTNIMIACSYLLLRATALNFNNSFNFYSDNSIYASSLLVRLVTFSKVFWKYIQLLIFPYPLHMERKMDVVTSLVSIWPVITIVLIIGLLVLSVREYLRKKTVYILFGLAWFICGLLPVSGIIPINGILYEHWLYLPMVGFYIMLYGLIFQLLPNQATRLLQKNYIYILMSLLLVFSVLTIRQNFFWSTPTRFYEYLLRYTDSARIHNNLGMAYAEEKQYDKAIVHYTKALSYGEDNTAMFHNMGNAYRDRGDLEKAANSYEKALESNPEFFFTYIPLLQTYEKLGTYEKGFRITEVAEKSHPNEPIFYAFEIEFSHKTGDTKRANVAYEKAKKQFENNPLVVQQFTELKKSLEANTTVK